MNKKLLVCLCALVLCGFSVFGQDSERTCIASNMKVDTFVRNDYKNKKFSIEGLVKFGMVIGSWYPENCEFYVDFYKIDEIMDADEFDDDYIYGTGIMAIVSLNYGIVELKYYRYADETVSMVGWDDLYFLRLNDGRVACLGVIKKD